MAAAETAANAAPSLMTVSRVMVVVGSVVGIQPAKVAVQGLRWIEDVLRTHAPSIRAHGATTLRLRAWTARASMLAPARAVNVIAPVGVHEAKIPQVLIASLMGVLL